MDKMTSSNLDAKETGMNGEDFEIVFRQPQVSVIRPTHE